MFSPIIEFQCASKIVERNALKIWTLKAGLGAIGAVRELSAGFQSELEISQAGSSTTQNTFEADKHLLTPFDACSLNGVR